MKKFFCCLTLLGYLVLPACASADFSALRLVRHVSDGDTLVLDNGEKVRLIGVDTPEIHDDQRRNAAHAAKYGRSVTVIDEFSQKAKEFVRKTVEGQKVRLEYDWDKQDKYGRTLAYVYRSSDGLFLNAQILKEGYGFAYTRFPFKYSNEFRQYEVQARRDRQGLWR